VVIRISAFAKSGITRTRHREFEVAETLRENQVRSSLEDAWRQSRLSGEISTGKPNRHIGILRFADPEDKATGAFEITNHEIARSSEDRPSLRTCGRD
jgi:hypothetical protein